MNLQEHEIHEWLEADGNDRGYRHYTDDEIVSEVIPEDTTPRDCDDDSDVSLEQMVISHDEAMDMFDKCLKWLQQQDEANVYNTNVLYELQEMAAKKRFSELQNQA